MWTALKGLFTSKKFWLSTLLAPVVLGIVASVLPILGVSEEMTVLIVKWVGTTIFGGVAGIGMADFGKASNGG